MRLRNSLVTALLLSYNSLVSAEPCPSMCNGHGRCDEPARQCLCYDGYQSGDCSEMICPFGKAWTDQATAIDDAHHPAECSNMGVCDRSSGLCMCREGFEGKACERKTCPNQCNHNGKCQSMLYYAETKDAGEGTIYTYTNQWDAEMMHGCHCDPQYHGPDCSLRYCPKGDDPLTGNTASIATNPRQFNEVQKVFCRAGEGTFTLAFRKKTTDAIPYNAKASEVEVFIEALVTVGDVKVDMYGMPGQACTETGTEWTVEFRSEFGDIPMLVPNLDNLGYGNSVYQVALAITEQVKGTKEDEECSNRGICSPELGVCSCSTDYDASNGYNQRGTRGDCGFATTTIQQCPGTLSCSGHGVCRDAPTYRCSCSDGWTGADCSDRTCPKGASWFTRPQSNDFAHVYEDVECSDMGICNREEGKCECMPGFTGDSCNRMTCPGPEEAPCSQHGQCLDMASLAEAAEVNGDSADFTYGATPNKASTWDAYRMFGCLCDPKWTGYDCSLRTCPFGDDPNSVGQVDEMQIIKCIDAALDGNVVLSFRQANTDPIPATATRDQVKAALEALTTIDKVAVDYGTQASIDQLCDPTGQTSFIVSFLTEHGDVPLMLNKPESIDLIEITEYRVGTKENWECSRRGLCDRSTGDCKCFTGYGSSDGMGGKGHKGDCGYIEPITIRW